MCKLLLDVATLDSRFELLHLILFISFCSNHFRVCGISLLTTEYTIVLSNLLWISSWICYAFVFRLFFFINKTNRRKIIFKSYLQCMINLFFFRIRKQQFFVSFKKFSARQIYKALMQSLKYIYLYIYIYIFFFFANFFRGIITY